MHRNKITDRQQFIKINGIELKRIMVDHLHPKSAHHLLNETCNTSVSGENLAGASARIVLNGRSIDIPAEHVTATNTQVTISKDYLDGQDVFSTPGAPAEFVFATPGGTASFTCLIAG